jgi:hypothetical protein
MKNISKYSFLNQGIKVILRDKVKLISQHRYIFIISTLILILLIWFFLLTSITETVSKKDNANLESNFNQNSSTITEKIICTEEWEYSPICKERTEALIEIKKYSELKEKLVSLNVQIWAEKEYTDLIETSKKSEELFKQEYFGNSAESYAEVNEGFTDLITQSSKILEDYIRSGFKKLEVNKSTEAIVYFDRALAIEEENIQAQEGRSRAIVLDKLLSIINEIKILIEINDLDTAKNKIEKALQLDNKNNEVVLLNKKLQVLLNQKEFDINITEGYINIEANNFSKALDSFQRAFDLEPSSQAAISGIFETKQIIKTNKIKELQKQALNFENQEQWKLALIAYNEIISINTNYQDAISGVLKANKMILLESEIGRLLSQPIRLESPDVAIEARNIISTSEKLKLGPGIQLKINSLIAILDKYSSRVKLQLISDGKTTITILKAGNIGKFKNKELQLSPGKYTFIGKRSGYKTIRKIIEIKKDSKLEITCFQRI